jgi:SHS2 domain-containing protein
MFVKLLFSRKQLSIILDGMGYCASGFCEIEHTADWELLVWAPSMELLLECAARGMNSLAGMHLRESPRIERDFHIDAADPETRLVSFLSELLYLGELEGLGFDDFQLAIEGDILSAVISGAPIASIDKEIKAVTYHELEIIKTPRGMEVKIVFDV